MDIIQDITVAGKVTPELVYIIFLYETFSIANT